MGSVFPYPWKSWWTCDCLEGNDTICLLGLGRTKAMRLLPDSSGLLAFGMVFGLSSWDLSVMLWEAHATRRRHVYRCSRWQFQSLRDSNPGAKQGSKEISRWFQLLGSSEQRLQILQAGAGLPLCALFTLLTHRFMSIIKYLLFYAAKIRAIIRKKKTSNNYQGNFIY